MATLAERLASVQAAIAAIEGGAQSISISGRTYTYANLDTLYKQEEYLENKIDRASQQASGSCANRTVAEF